MRDILPPQDKTQKTSIEIDAEPRGLCASPDDYSFIKQLAKTLPKADANNDEVITRLELEDFQKKNAQPCSKRVVENSLKNFDQLTSMAPDNMKALNPNRFQNSELELLLRTDLLDPQSNKVGITQKDLSVAQRLALPSETQRLVDRARATDEEARWGPFAYNILPLAGTAILGLFSIGTRSNPAASVAGGTAILGFLGTFGYATYNALTYKNESPLAEKQIQERQRAIKSLRESS